MFEHRMSYAADQAVFMELANQTTDEWNEVQSGRYIEHLKEEAGETEAAWERRDWVKTVDGLVDTIVVALGGLLSFGINPDEAWDAVMRSNFGKVNGEFGPVSLRPDGQVAKPDPSTGWRPPEADLQVLVDKAKSES